MKRLKRPGSSKLSWLALLSALSAGLIMAACGGGGGDSDGDASADSTQAAGKPTVAFGITGAPVAEQVYTLQSSCGSKMLDVFGVSSDNGAVVHIWTANGGANQRFKFKAAGDSRFLMVAEHSGKLLDAKGFGTTNGTRVHQWQTNGQANQIWIVTDNGDGTHKLINQNAPGMALDVSGASTADGARVQLWQDNGTCAQRWILKPVGGTGNPVTPPSVGDYQRNLNLVLAATTRNRNHDNSRFLNTALGNLPINELLGPRSEYLGLPGGNPEGDFPVTGVGTFRTACEFSHFAYDDPLVYPGRPGASHLHMFFGNTHVNANSTYETLRDSGSSTCNGMELNRTGYWAPAMFDAQGNVRVPERIIVYYKGYGMAQGNSIVFPPRAAMVTKQEQDVHKVSPGLGGTEGMYEQVTFQCTDQFRSGPKEPMGNTMPNCTAKSGWRPVLEMHVKFPNCWNRQDPSNPNNFTLSGHPSTWFGSICGDRATLPNMEYIIAYPLEPGESTAGWYLSSDVSPATRQINKAPGSSSHADWWGAWHPDINKQWIDNCVNFKSTTDHGCGFGYLSNGGPNGDAPLPGPALKYRPQYTGPVKVPAATIYRELCDSNQPSASALVATHCRPN